MTDGTRVPCRLQWLDDYERDMAEHSDDPELDSTEVRVWAGAHGEEALVVMRRGEDGGDWRVEFCVWNIAGWIGDRGWGAVGVALKRVARAAGVDLVAAVCRCYGVGDCD